MKSSHYHKNHDNVCVILVNNNTLKYKQMYNFFKIANDLNYPILQDYSQAPETCGFYTLHDERDSFLYVGKANNLRQRLSDHFSQYEQNARIRGYVRYVYYRVTRSIEEAEIEEGRVFDSWVLNTGQYPFANEIRPPRSGLTQQQILQIQYRNLFG